MYAISRAQLQKLILAQTNQTNKLHGLNPRANYSDRATAACWRSLCQFLRIEGCSVVSAADPLWP
jgi:hypothetical protein